MPLRDHFRPPLDERRPWRSFHATWCSSLADLLNNDLLPPGYLALEYVSPGPAIEIDVATFTNPHDPNTNGYTATLPRTLWTPATAPVVLPFEFAEQASVEIHETGGGRALVATIELVSPGNKDRETKRRQFTAECLTHLSNGVGVVVVDVVTTRSANLHAELLGLLGHPSPAGLSELYTVAYRPLSQEGGGRIECWPMPLRVGQALPSVPLSLSAECCIRVDLEASYRDASQRRRLDEV
jgi:hypothetical protein